jgi:hypothetical protein
LFYISITHLVVLKCSFILKTKYLYIENLPLKAIRAAADTRGVSSEGKRDEIIMRIETSVLNEEESIYIDEIERIELAERDLEAMGSVYTFGNGDVGQLGLGGSKLISSSVCKKTRKTN